MVELSPTGHFSPGVSLFVAIAVAAAFFGILAWMVLAMIRHRIYGRQADALHDEDAALEVGASMVAGVVELDEGVPFGARVEIEQEGSEQTDGEGVTTHRWRETGRKTFSRRFWIRHTSGERVLVETAKRVHLVDKLDIQVHDEARRRFRIAELSEGENVIAEGRLERQRVGKPAGAGYRDGSELQWVLRPKNEVERLHLSAEKLGQGHRRKASRIAKLIWMIWLPSAVAACALLTTYLARVTSGVSYEATITGKEHYTTTGDNGTTNHHWRIDYVYSGRHRDAHVSRSDFDRIDQGDQIQVIHVRMFRAACAIGREPTLHALLGFGAASMFLVPLLMFRFVVRRREWYESDVTDQGSGPLPKAKASTERVYSRE